MLTLQEPQLALAALAALAGHVEFLMKLILTVGFEYGDRRDPAPRQRLIYGLAG